MAEEKSKFEQLRERHEWLDHVVRAGARYTERHGDHYAAAVTYFSVLSLVPLLMIAFAVAGFVLQAQPDLLHQLQANITKAVPGSLGQTLNGVIDQAIRSAGTVGVIGLLAALYSGIGWMTSLRDALSEQWGRVPEPPPLIRRTVVDLLSLLGLGAALVVSFALTGLGTGFAGSVLAVLGLSEQAWAQVLLGLLGFVLSILANWLIFLWVIARLPREDVALKSAVRAALLGAVGFEVIKQIMTIYLGVVTNSPSGAVFGSFLGLLVFAYFVSRFVLFVTAWAATSKENESEAPAEVPGPAVIRPEFVVASRPSGGAAAGLLGVGAVAGVLGALLLRRR